MTEILKKLEGYRTYITALLFAVFNIGAVLGWWGLTNEIWTIVNTSLATFGFGFMRAGMKRNK